MTPRESLESVVREVEAHAARAGWDQPAQLFALVDTADLLAREPQLASLLGIEEAEPGALTPVEQDAVEQSLQDLLPAILWPPEVAGCAVVVEATTLPEGQVVTEETAEELAQELALAATGAPERQEARVVAGALRGGESFCAIRQRAHDEDDLVLAGPDLVPGLLQLLHATLEPDVGEPR